jgi:hypothetical protein
MHPSIGMSPFKANTGYDMTPTGSGPTWGHDVPLQLAQLKKLHEWCQLWLNKAQGQYKKAFDKKHQEPKALKDGNQVWLSSHDLTTDQPSPKIEALWYGPFRVKSIKGPLTYELDLPSHWHVHPVFHHLKLKKVHTATLGPENPAPFPEVTVTDKRYVEQDKSTPEQTPNTCPRSLTTATPWHSPHHHQ